MDIIYHFLVGFILVLLSNKTKLSVLTVLVLLVMVALLKELYDHCYILGHINCYREHLKDIFFTVLPVIFQKGLYERV